MKKISVDFTCDQCNKTKTCIGDDTDNIVFPMKEGWINVHTFDITLPAHSLVNNRHNIDDLHFCSKKCALHYVNDVLNRSENVEQQAPPVRNNKFDDEVIDDERAINDALAQRRRRQDVDIPVEPKKKGLFR